jgi:hypothetical protein
MVRVWQKQGYRIEGQVEGIVRTGLKCSWRVPRAVEVNIRSGLSSAGLKSRLRCR